jgi:hypothetical protein
MFTCSCRKAGCTTADCSIETQCFDALAFVGSSTVMLSTACGVYTPGHGHFNILFFALVPALCRCNMCSASCPSLCIADQQNGAISKACRPRYSATNCITAKPVSPNRYEQNMSTKFFPQDQQVGSNYEACFALIRICCIGNTLNQCQAGIRCWTALI